MEQNIRIGVFRDLVAISRSYNDLAKRCGYKYCNMGIQYKLDQRMIKLGCSSIHFLGRSWSKGISRPECSNKADLSDFLVQNKYCKSSHLKKRLIKELDWIDKCTWCGIGPEYNGKPITLQLDHINGNNCDNRIENLRILCPNCHSQTDTWCAKKRTKSVNFDDVVNIPRWFFKESIKPKTYKQYVCDICKVTKVNSKSKMFDGYRCKECYLKSVTKFNDVIGIPRWFFKESIKPKVCDICKVTKVNSKSKMFDGYRCKECYLKSVTKEKKKLRKSAILLVCDICKINKVNRKSKVFNGYRCSDCSLKSNRKVKNRPSRKELLELLMTNPYTKVGEMYGVSDNCIRKWLK